MSDQSGVFAAEERFFASLTAANISALDDLLTPDFILVDLSGSVLDRSALLTVIESGQLKFGEIRAIESTIRFYGSTAIVTGRTEMKGVFAEVAFSIQSRYTHVYVERQESWRLASAQGTPVTVAT